MPIITNEIMWELNNRLSEECAVFCFEPYGDVPGTYIAVQMRTRFLAKDGIRLNDEGREFVHRFFSKHGLEVEFLPGIDAFTTKKPDAEG